MSRTARFPCEPTPPPETAPVPTLAAWDDAHHTLLTVTFDKPLLDQPLDKSNWEVELAGGGAVGAASATVIAFGPTGEMQLTFGDSVDNGVNVIYHATPPDVVGTNMLEVAAFVWPL